MEVEAFTRMVGLSAAPAVTAGAYSTGNCIGTLMTLAGAVRGPNAGGIIQKVTCSFLATAPTALDILFFNANPTGTTFTDKSAVAVVAADLPKIIGVVHMSDFTNAAAATMIFGFAGQIALPFLLSGETTTLYAIAVARAAFTPTGTADFAFKAVVLQ